MTIRLRPKYVSDTFQAFSEDPLNPETQAKVIDIARRAPLYAILAAMGRTDVLLSFVSKYESVRKINTSMSKVKPSEVVGILAQVEASMPAEEDEEDAETDPTDDVDIDQSETPAPVSKRGRKKSASAVAVADNPTDDLSTLFDE